MGDYLNCNCQCDSYTWSDGKYTRGNCKSKAKLPGKYTSATGLFCYVSGSALCSCRDVQVSKSVTDSYGRPRYYSFEACTTPPRNRCNSYGSNFGDGDFPFCVNSGSGSYRPDQAQDHTALVQAHTALVQALDHTGLDP